MGVVTYSIGENAKTDAAKDSAPLDNVATEQTAVAKCERWLRDLYDDGAGFKVLSLRTVGSSRTYQTFTVDAVVQRQAPVDKKKYQTTERCNVYWSSLDDAWDRYIGASAMWAWQFAKMQHAADLHGWTRFVSMQDQYSLMHREEEREMFGLLSDQGVGGIPYSPLAKGRLARPWGGATARAANDPVAERSFSEADKPIADAVQKNAEARGIPMAHVALRGC